jgi:hypothetical protein
MALFLDFSTHHSTIPVFQYSIPHRRCVKFISHDEAVKLMEGLKPGDLIITNEDGSLKFEMAQKAMGKTGNWTHIGLISDKDSVLEVLIESDSTVETKLEECITNNHHVIILRPSYKNADEVKKVIDEARSLLGKVSYDHSFDMKSDDKMYCLEYVYKVMKKGAPGIEVNTFKVLGREVLTADDYIQSKDMKVVKSTGSSFWLNFLSKFD